MAKQANILSFDDAKRNGANHANASVRSDRHRSRMSKGSNDTPRSRSNSASFAGSSPRLARTEYSASRGVPSWLAAAQEQTARETRNFRNDSRSQRHSAIMSYDDFLEEEREEGSEESAARGKKTLFQKISDARRKRTKAKAGKAFTRQFGDSSSSSDSAPRAAVYKGEMGASQRRAQRMQSDGSTKSRRVDRAAMKAAQPKQGFLGWLTNAAGGISAAVTAPFAGKSAAPSSRHGKETRPSSSFSVAKFFGVLFGTPRRIAVISVAACLAVACVFMYPAAKQYYTELRHLDQVQAEYEAVVARNTELTATRNYLQSDAGVEEMAHDKYGWVTEGENSVLVYGLPEDDAIADTNLYIKRGSVPAPETWYSVILDPFFGLE